MTTKNKNRIKSFVWRYGLFVGVAITTYLSNVGNIQEIDITKLVTIFVTVTATYVGNEITKRMNTGK